MNIINRISAAISAFGGRSVQLSNETTMQLLDRKVGQQLAKNQTTPTKHTAEGMISSDDVADLAWQSQEALINLGTFTAAGRLIGALVRKDDVAAEQAAIDYQMWNYCLGAVDFKGELKSKYTIAETEATLKKAAVPQSAEPCDKATMVILARLAGMPADEYIGEELNRIASENASRASHVDTALKMILSTSTYQQDAATMKASTAQASIERQLKWMARSWKNKALVGQEAHLMLADIEQIAKIAKREQGLAVRYEDGVTTADAFTQSDNDSGRKTDRLSEPSDLEKAFQEAEQAIVQSEIVANRRRIIKRAA